MKYTPRFPVHNPEKDENKFFWILAKAAEIRREREALARHRPSAKLQAANAAFEKHLK